jgi:hypothetical protein
MRALSISLLLVLILPGAARAQQDAALLPPPPAAAAPKVADASFQAMLYRWVELRLDDGREIKGQLVLVDADTVGVAPVGAEALLFEKAKVVSLLAGEAPLPARVVAARPEPLESGAEPRERHFGAQFGVLPGLLLDVDYGYVYGFASMSILFPALESGRWIPLAFGAGVNLPRDSAWKMEVFALYAPSCVEPSGKWWYHGYGLGLGVHYTSSIGLTLSFKVPVLGSAFRTGRWEGAFTVSDRVRRFYISGFSGMPFFTIGYRF